MERDIVQFVAMRDFQTEYSRYLLPKAVLEEIPDQFLSYMKKEGIRPSPPINIEQVKLIESRNKSYSSYVDSKYGNVGGSKSKSKVGESKNNFTSNSNENSDIPPEYYA